MKRAIIFIGILSLLQTTGYAQEANQFNENLSIEAVASADSGLLAAQEPQHIITERSILFTNTAFTKPESTETSAKSAIYLSAGTVFLYSSVNVNYDFRIKQSEGFFKNYYATIEAGVFNTNSGFAPGYSTNGFTTGIGVIGLTGKGNGHFETSLGLSLNIETEINGDDPDDLAKEEAFILPELSLGYRYQKANGVMFRAGIGFPQTVYIGVGYSF